MKSKNIIALFATIGIFTVATTLSENKNNNIDNDTFTQSDSGIGKEDTINSMLTDKDGNFWVGNNKGKLYERANGENQFNVVPITGLDPSATLKHMMQDKNGNIWIATATKVSSVLYKKDANNDQFLKYTEGLNGELLHNFTDIIQDNSNNIWLADGYRFLYKLNDGDTEFKLITTNKVGVLSIAEDKDGNLWFIDGKHKLWKEDAGSETFQEFDNSENQLNNIWKVYADSENNIWLGGESGIYEKTSLNDVFIQTSLNYSVGDKSFAGTMFYEDIKKNLWVATDKNGLFQKTGDDIFTQFTNGLPSDLQLRSIGSDKNGYLWLGTINSGAYNSDFQIISDDDKPIIKPASLSIGEITGITLGSVAGAILIALSIYFGIKKLKKATNK